ncbi:MAG TPA: hypothetical protein VFF52_10045, partial [Isosphaeraceae bacterium]|nr:hypothetical protein [Isosphaeraceae bacterium]
MRVDAPRGVWRRTRALSHVAPPARAGRATVPVVEALEVRELLSFYNGPAATRPFIATGGLYQAQVSGPGVVNVRPAGTGAINLVAYGTTAASTVTITQTQPRYHFPNQLLQIHTLTVKSGQLGGLDAATAELTGRMTTLTNDVTTFDLGALGPKSQVVIDGDLGEMSVSSVVLGPTGHVEIADDLTSGAVTIGTMTLDGGRFAIGRDALEPVTIQGNVTILRDGQLAIGRDATSAL